MDNEAETFRRRVLRETETLILRDSVPTIATDIVLNAESFRRRMGESGLVQFQLPLRVQHLFEEIAGLVWSMDRDIVLR